MGVSAYAGAAPYIENDAVLVPALGIHSVEARHASYLRTLNGDTNFPNVIDAPRAPDRKSRKSLLRTSLAWKRLTTRRTKKTVRRKAAVRRAVPTPLTTELTLPTTAQTLPTTAQTLPTTAQTLPTTAQTLPTTAQTLPTTAQTLPTTTPTPRPDGVAKGTTAEQT